MMFFVDSFYFLDFEWFVRCYWMPEEKATILIVYYYYYYYYILYYYYYTLL